MQETDKQPKDIKSLFSPNKSDTLEQQIKLDKSAFSIDKVFQAEHEKELKEIENVNDKQKQQVAQRGSKRTKKRKRNQAHLDITGIELGIETNIDNTKRVFSNKIRKYFDRIKMNMCEYHSVSDMVAKAYLFSDYQTLAKSTEISDPVDTTPKVEEIEETKDGKDKPESQESKRGRKSKNKTKKTKITDKFGIGGEDELNIALEKFFIFLYENRNMNLYEF